MAITIAIANGKTIAKATAEGKIVAKAVAEDKILARFQGQYNNIKKNQNIWSYHLNG